MQRGTNKFFQRGNDARDQHNKNNHERTTTRRTERIATKRTSDGPTGFRLEVMAGGGIAIPSRGGLFRPSGAPTCHRRHRRQPTRGGLSLRLFSLLPGMPCPKREGAPPSLPRGLTAFARPLRPSTRTFLQAHWLHCEPHESSPAPYPAKDQHIPAIRSEKIPDTGTTEAARKAVVAACAAWARAPATEHGSYWSWLGKP
mmetsp:Transcript_113017/g.258879  ORF Transcript_113017/g.258879 Transcript_113017/m.258879 type:complete len:200 (-) Transcript_113017:9-608(-)